MRAMMSDREFAELELKATICPGQCQWPEPGPVHWQKLHEGANEARARVSKFFTLAGEIDCNADLSRDDKYLRRRKTASEAIADLEASKTLARVRQAVEFAVANHKFEQVDQDSDVILKAMKELERGWQKAMNKIAERAG
jgi:hypothetical protein